MFTIVLSYSSEAPSSCPEHLITSETSRFHYCVTDFTISLVLGRVPVSSTYLCAIWGLHGVNVAGKRPLSLLVIFLVKTLFHFGTSDVNMTLRVMLNQHSNFMCFPPSGSHRTFGSPRAPDPCDTLTAPGHVVKACSEERDVL